ncbi:hypothetical protein APW67_07350, partial [Staphylococcus aureus]
VRLGKEINPKFKIGTMISHVPIYPYSCHPKDMMEAQIANRLRFFFPDVQVRGYYPSYAKKMLARKGYDVLLDTRLLQDYHFLSMLPQNSSIKR